MTARCPVCQVRHTGHELPTNDHGIYEPDGRCIFLGTPQHCWERLQHIGALNRGYAAGLAIRSVTP